jgi:perosamine synthetase
MSWFVFVVRLKDQFTPEQRNAVLEGMSSRGIGVSNYFAPVHLQPFIVEQLGCKEGDFPVTDMVSSRTIALPFYNNLTKDDASIVCSELGEVLDEIL